MNSWDRLNLRALESSRGLSLSVSHLVFLLPRVKKKSSCRLMMRMMTISTLDRIVCVDVCRAHVLLLSVDIRSWICFGDGSRSFV